MKPAAKFPSFNWLRGVSDDKRISVIHRLILIRILIHRDKDGLCDPGYNVVAKELGIDRKTVNGCRRCRGPTRMARAADQRSPRQRQIHLPLP
jgi:hypothetical protein